MKNRTLDPMRIVRQVTSLSVAILLIGAIGVIGVRNYRGSEAATPPSASMTLTPASATWDAGTTVAVTVNANSGAEAVNAVQASLVYNPNNLQYVSITEGSAFPIVAATSTESGVIRVGRAVSEGGVTGNNAVVIVRFKVLGGADTTSLKLDQAYSYIVRSSDNKDILKTAETTSYAIKNTGSVTGSGKPAFRLDPPTGTYRPGSNIAVAVRVSTGAATLTAVQPIINYPADHLEFVDVKEGTAFTTIQRTKNAAGSLDIIRGVPGGSAGASGDQLVVTANFKVLKETNSAKLTFASASAAFDKSGTGQNVLDLPNSSGGIYVLSATAPLTAAPASTVQKMFSIAASQGGEAKVTKDGTTVSGQIELKPSGSGETGSTTGDTITKVEYFLDNELVATKTESPFTHVFDTRILKNNVYAVAVKTHYKSGAVESGVGNLDVANPVNLAYVARHNGLAIGMSLILGIAAAFIVWRYVLPSFKHNRPGTGAFGGFGGGSSGGGPGGQGPRDISQMVGSLNRAFAPVENYVNAPVPEVQSTAVLPVENYSVAPTYTAQPGADVMPPPNPVQSIQPVETLAPPQPQPSPEAAPVTPVVPDTNIQPVSTATDTPPAQPAQSETQFYQPVAPAQETPQPQSINVQVAEPVSEQSPDPVAVPDPEPAVAMPAAEAPVFIPADTPQVPTPPAAVEVTQHPVAGQIISPTEFPDENRQ